MTDWLQAHERGERAVMLAHRRCDVADLNERARRGLRAVGRIGGDELRTDARAFAVGDRVVARRNDRRLGVVNGDTGCIATIAGGRVAVELDDGREVALTERYVRAGHLEHGYALTAHLAQGATVDRAFVLGSDELYREWGYTALTRHRLEARFYVSATPAFLNESDVPLEAPRDVTQSVARMLAASRSQRLASDSARSDPMREAIADALDDARRELASLEETMTALREQRQELRWHQRSAIRTLERRIDDWRRPCDHWRAETHTALPRARRAPGAAGAVPGRRSAARRPAARPRPRSRSQPRLGARAMTGQLSLDDLGTPRGLTRSELMTAREVAELLDVPISTVREWGRNGTLPRVKLGRHVRFIRQHVEAAILHAENSRG